MRWFIGEFLCGGGMLDTELSTIPDSLLIEGTAMWNAIVADVSTWADVVTPIDNRLQLAEPVKNVTKVPMVNLDDPIPHWLDLAEGCDVAILIAPETDGLFGDVVTAFRNHGIKVAAVCDQFLSVAADKWATASWLMDAGIAHPITYRRKGEMTGPVQPDVNLNPANASASPLGAFLIKPRSGCGSEAIRRCRDWQTALETITDDEIVQAELEGRAASVTVIGSIESDSVITLPAVWQEIQMRPNIDDSVQTVCQYQGGQGPIDANLQERAHSLVKQVIAAMPSRPVGFMGIDILLGETASDDVVIEVNPRLTTSYIGLRQMTRDNLTRWLVDRQGAEPRFDSPVDSVTWRVARQ